MKKSFEVSRVSIMMTIAAIQTIKVPGAFLLGKAVEWLGNVLKESGDAPYFRITIESTTSAKDPA